MRSTSLRHQQKIISKFQRVGRGGGNGGGIGSPGAAPRRTIPVPVLTTDWTADNSGYIGAPNSTIGPGGNGEAQYADIRHGLGSLTVMAVGYRDHTDGRRWGRDVFIDQKEDATYPTMILRVWLPEVPAGTITVFVQAY